MDYRLLSLIALLAWGGWAFLTKIAGRHLQPPVLVFWVTVSGLVPMLGYVLMHQGVRWERGAGLAWAAGILGGIATTAFYLALARGPASVVVPLSGMYVLVPALLGFIFLREPVTLTHVVGVLCAGAAVFFLTR